MKKDTFKMNDSVIVIDGEFKGKTGTISKISPTMRSLSDKVYKLPKEYWAEKFFEYDEKYGNKYNIFLDDPIDTEQDVILHIEIEDVLVDHYQAEITNSFCCYRDNDQLDLRNRLIKYLKEQKITMHQFAKDSKFSFTRIGEFKNYKSGYNGHGRPVRYLYPKEYYLLKKYLISVGY